MLVFFCAVLRPRQIVFCTTLVAAAPAAADNCPAAPDHGAELAELTGQVKAAEGEGEARAIAVRMWQLWTDAPDAQAQAILDRGMERRTAFNFLGALEDFDSLVAYCPEFAEGYNQRAFVYYLNGEFESALKDLDRALGLSPAHIGALSGRALTLMGLSRTDEAREALQMALALNPWLPERSLIAPGGPLAPQGGGNKTPSNAQEYDL
jgi:tetratricopeptide (TPR) repeat protein